MDLATTTPGRLREALSLSLLALDAAQKSGAIGPVWQADKDAIAEIRAQLPKPGGTP